MKAKLQLLIIFLLCFLNHIYSQELYNAKVIDEQNQAIDFAHIFFKNDQAKGAITNEVGSFSIYVSEYNLQDSLVISVLGYKTLVVAFQDITKYKNSFQLESSSLMLNEVTILSDTYLRYLLKEAIAKIPDNYPQEKHLQKVYYQNYTISDSTYAEMIEADISIVCNGYDQKKIKKELYINQLSRTDDNRNLPDRLRSDNNKVFITLNSNCIAKRSFSKFIEIGNKVSLSQFAESVDDIKEIQVYGQYVNEGDTILTIKVSDPSFNIMGSKIFSLVSINKSDMAIVKVVYGNVWADKEDFSEVVYRKINGKYYPSYMRSVLEFEYEQKTKKHYTSRILLFYDVITGKKSIQKYDKGKRMKSEKGLRLLKMNRDDNFWNEYLISNQITATEILRAKMADQY